MKWYLRRTSVFWGHFFQIRLSKPHYAFILFSHHAIDSPSRAFSDWFENGGPYFRVIGFRRTKYVKYGFCIDLPIYTEIETPFYSKECLSQKECWVCFKSLSRHISQLVGCYVKCNNLSPIWPYIFDKQWFGGQFSWNMLQSVLPTLFKCLPEFRIFKKGKWDPKNFSLPQKKNQSWQHWDATHCFDPFSLASRLWKVKVKSVIDQTVKFI